MEREAVERLELETDLRQGLERNEFRVMYQPILSLVDGQIVEVEALVRWEHPTRDRFPRHSSFPLRKKLVSSSNWVFGCWRRPASRRLSGSGLPLRAGRWS
jgi:predicted signal transduction protein with EAL and GGDEF domain